MQERQRPDDRPYPRPRPDRRNALSRWRSERAPRRSDRHSRKNLTLARRQRLTCLAGRTLKRGPSSIGITLRVASSTLRRSARLRRRHMTVHGSDYRSGDRQERGERRTVCHERVLHTSTSTRGSCHPKSATKVRYECCDNLATSAASDTQRTLTALGVPNV